MSAIIVGVAGPLWGTVDQSSMILENIKSRHTVEEEPLPNGQGDIIGACFHGGKGEISAEFTIKNASTAPAKTLRGHQFTISGDSQFAGTYYIREVERSRQKGKWMSGSLVATEFDETVTTTTTTT
jgi:hypothetical protein